MQISRLLTSLVSGMAVPESPRLAAKRQCTRALSGWKRRELFL